MEYKIHPIKKYSFAFDARLGRVGKMQLWGEKGEIAQIDFWEDGAAVTVGVGEDGTDFLKTANSDVHKIDTDVKEQH